MGYASLQTMDVRVTDLRSYIPERFTVHGNDREGKPREPTHVHVLEKRYRKNEQPRYVASVMAYDIALHNLHTLKPISTDHGFVFEYGVEDGSLYSVKKVLDAVAVRLSNFDARADIALLLHQLLRQEGEKLEMTVLEHEKKEAAKRTAGTTQSHTPTNTDLNE